MYYLFTDCDFDSKVLFSFSFKKKFEHNADISFTTESIHMNT